MNPAKWGRRGQAWLAAGLLAVAALFVGVGLLFRDVEPSRRLSPVEAACEALAAGDSVDETYDLLVGLLDGKVVDPEVTALAAVTRAAHEGGC